MSETDAATEDRVREMAYHLWEQAGCPEGRSTEFWYQAVSEIGVDEMKPIAEEFETKNDGPPLKAA